MPIAVVTGSSTGIGQASAITLARAGHTVYATMRNPQTGGEELRLIADKENLPLRLAALQKDRLKVLGRLALIGRTAHEIRQGRLVFIDDGEFDAAEAVVVAAPAAKDHSDHRRDANGQSKVEEPGHGIAPGAPKVFG